MGTLIVDGAGSIFEGGAVVHVGSDFDFDTFEAIYPGGVGAVVQTGGGQILGEILVGSGIVQVASTASTEAVLSATGESALDTVDGTYDTGGELEEEPGLEETAANEGESEDSSDGSTDKMGQCE